MMKSAIRLEHFTEEDFAQLIAWVVNEELLVNWTGHMFSFPLTEKKLAWYIKETNDIDTSDALVYKAVDSTTGKAVGHISLGSISRRNSAARISRVLVGDTCAQGKGICQQMVMAVLKIGFEELQLHRISLGVYDFNHSAIRCYQKCGFVVEGTSRDVLKRDNGEYWSLVEMSMLANEWRAVHNQTAAK